MIWINVKTYSNAQFDVLPSCPSEQSFFHKYYIDKAYRPYES